MSDTPQTFPTAPVTPPPVIPPQPDHTPDEKAALTPEENARAVELRALRFPSDAEKAESAALNLREADLAGHVVPESPPEATPEDARHSFVVDRIAAAFDHLAAVLPSAAPLARIAAELRGHAAALIDPPKADKPVE